MFTFYTAACLTFYIFSKMVSFIVSSVTILWDCFNTQYHVYMIWSKAKYFVMLTLYVDCYGTFQLLLVHDKLLPLDIVMDFPSLRFASSLIKAFGSSFMDSLVLLNVQ